MSLCYSFTLFSVKENFLFFFFLRLTWALHMNKHFALLMKGHCTNVCLHLLILCVLFNIRIFHWDLTSSNGSIQTFIRVAQFRMFSMRFHRWNLWFQICLNWISFLIQPNTVMQIFLMQSLVNIHYWLRLFSTAFWVE